MAAVIEPDQIDFAAYERQTDPVVKVRKASAFVDDLYDEFTERVGAQYPSMLSTKLRNDLQFRPGEVTAWAGFNGHRKSMFTGQVALDLMAQNQRTLVASFEMLPAKTLARMARQASGSRQPAHGWLKAFAQWTDSRLWLFDHLGRFTPDQCIAVCRYFADEIKGQHVFIDSMMMVCASEESMDAQKQFITDLVRMAQETGLHVHLITHCRKPQSGEEKPPSKYDVRGAAAISDQVANVVTVWANKAKKAKLEQNSFDETALQEPDALVTVEKQRNGEWEGRARLWFHSPSMRFTDERLTRIDAYSLEAA